MDDYRKLVKRLADGSSADLIPNGGTDHAEVLIENIFAHAQSSVRVFSGELNSRVYGSDSVVSEAQDFLLSNRNAKLNILLQDIDDLNELSGHQLIDICSQVGEDRCQIKTAAPQDRELGSHFVIMDEKGYRVEPDKSRPAGIGCFNDPKLAKKLNDQFDEMFERGVPLPYPQKCNQH